ncbi:MAG TPA: UDP-N-acetylmuramyl-tripeptide synthetase [Polyangiaceae bacterium]
MRAPPAPPAWASSLTSVGVTGTNGKTSTTGMVAALLGLLCRPVARVTTLGCFLEQELLDVPPHYDGFLETMRRCRDAGGRYAALELTSEALALGFAKAWPCRVGVFTNLSLDHSDAHGSPEHYLASKAQLFLSLGPGCCAVLNGCDENAQLVSEVVPEGAEVLHYGVASRGPAWAEELQLSASGIEPSLDGTRATLAPSARFPELPRQLELRASGAIFVENALAALGAALSLGVPAAAACAALAALPPPPGRFQVLLRNPDVVVDYAHTPDALERTLVTARALCRGTLTLVFGAGGDRDKLKRPLLGAAAAAADRIVLTSDNPRSERPEAIMDEIAAGIPATCSVLREVDRKRAIERAIAAAGADDLVLIAGKGHERTQELAGGRVPFSDVAIVRRYTKSAH